MSKSRLLCFTFCFLLASCSGGSDGGGTSEVDNESNSETVNIAPTANAGENQSVNENTQVRLSGEGDDADGIVLSYLWRQTSGKTVFLETPNSANTEFLAPEITSEETLVFQFTVTDSDGVTTSDLTTVVVTPFDSEPPSQTSISVILATNIDSISLAWNLVNDDTTEQADINYQVHQSTEQGFVHSSATLIAQGKSLVEYQAGNLLNNTDYFFKLIAADSNGNESISPEYSMQTLQNPIQVRDDVGFYTDDDLKLGVPVVNGDLLTFNKTADTKLPELGSIIYVEDNSGAGYLKHVEQIDDTGNSLEITTSNALLADVLDTGQVALKLDLPTFGEGIFSSQAQTQLLLTNSSTRKLISSPNKKQSSAKQKQPIVQQKSLHQAVNSKEQFLSCDPNSPSVTYSLDPINKAITIKDSTHGSNNAITITLKKIIVDPNLDVNLDWTLAGGLQDSHFIFDAKVEYETENKSSLALAFSESCKIELGKAAVPIRFFLGPVPVYLEIEFLPSITLTALIEAGFKGEFKSSKTIKVKMGTEYKRSDDQWHNLSVPVENTTHSASPKIEAFVGASFEAVYDPKVQLTAYKAAGVFFSHERHGKVELELGFEDSLEYLRGDTSNREIQLNKYNFLYFPECNIGLDSEFLHKKTSAMTLSLGAKHNLCEQATKSPEYFFGLSSLKFMPGNLSNKNQYHIIATPTSKGQGEFDASSAQWQIFPEDVTIEPVAGKPLEAIVNIENAQHKQYQVLMSGEDKTVANSRRTNVYKFSVYDTEIAGCNLSNYHQEDGYYRNFQCYYDETYDYYERVENFRFDKDNTISTLSGAFSIIDKQDNLSHKGLTWQYNTETQDYPYYESRRWDTNNFTRISGRIANQATIGVGGSGILILEIVYLEETYTDELFSELSSRTRKECDFKRPSGEFIRGSLTGLGIEAVKITDPSQCPKKEDIYKINDLTYQNSILYLLWQEEKTKINYLDD